MTKSQETGNLTTTRLETFTDGVFAIAITILVLEIKIPTAQQLQESGGLNSFLIHLWPNFIAYVWSFMIIGIYWAHHHYAIKLYRTVDHTLVILHVVFLMTIAFLPFPTALLGDLINDDIERPTAVILYTFGIFLPAFVGMIIWLYAKRNYRLLHYNIDPAFARSLTRQYYASNILNLGAFILAFFSPISALIINFIIMLIYLVPPRKIKYKT